MFCAGCQGPAEELKCLLQGGETSHTPSRSPRGRKGMVLTAMQRRTAGDGGAGDGGMRVMEMWAMESHRLTVLAELSGHAGRAAAGAGGRVAGAAVLAAAAQAAVLPEGAGRAGWGERGRRGQRPRAAPQRGPEGSSPASLTLVAEDAGPARRAVAAGALRGAGAAVLAVLAGQAAVGAKRALQADCNERSRG